MMDVREPGFCPQCGTILPLVGEAGGVTCYLCKISYGPEVFGRMEANYRIYFNRYSETGKKRVEMDEGEEADGPVVERRCPKCNNDRMSYATLQLRSADEGQTVFYTCTKCKFKENENS
ncbi:DNA-directed RNA polymerase I subunit RPA12-like [Homalodisca vitripennis]|uniref:DNA-directed RNA polymerase I subunit RPA12-like n=1 Tax=Homalodisca vitripennis TaxID=197043 RepID=UPI001EEA0FCA|nr:DNA-directed RNA polymerase I subunit RPA12-like [Homalodisca vitripennis]XP_046684958.1 DNA-directed RNA polymerase I subunit RPA12-like [Homalodisca vitripennis]KAG8248788.1 DNA-directed RNA polymerase I subunit RPA12 [Homalodisca vitripennis]